MFDFFELSRFLSRKVALYRFERDGLVLRFASCDRDVEIAGTVYKAARGITHSAVRDTTTSDKKAQLTVTAPYLLDAQADELPVTQELGNWWRPYPPSQRVLVTVMTTHLGDPDEQVNIEWMGRVVGPSYSRTEMRLTCDPSYRSGRTSGSIPRMQRGCGVALYSRGLGMCNLDPERLPVPAVLEAVDDTGVSAAAFGTPPRAFVGGEGGALSWLDEDEVLHTRPIVAHDGNRLTLGGAPHALAAGAAVVAYTVPLWFLAELNVVDGLRLTSPAFASAALSLAGGFIQWRRAEDDVLEVRSVMSHSGETIGIHYGATDIAPGLQVQAYLGCAHNLAACEAHGNQINYPGFRWLPTEDPMSRSQAW